MPELVKVGQGEHGLRPRQVLGQAAIAHLGEAHNCLTTRKACSPQARVRERARLIMRQRSLKGRRAVGRRLIR